MSKVVLARQVEVVANRPFVLPETLGRLAHLYPSCVVFQVEGFIGASPETLLRRTGAEIESHPLAGTVARSGDPATDDALVAALMSSAKDRHEHQLVVDEIAAKLRPYAAVEVPAAPSIVAAAQRLPPGDSDQGGSVRGHPWLGARWRRCCEQRPRQRCRRHYRSPPGPGLPRQPGASVEPRAGCRAAAHASRWRPAGRRRHPVAAGQRGFRPWLLRRARWVGSTVTGTANGGLGLRSAKVWGNRAVYVRRQRHRGRFRPRGRAGRDATEAPGPPGCTGPALTVGPPAVGPAPPWRSAAIGGHR